MKALLAILFLFVNGSVGYGQSNKEIIHLLLNEPDEEFDVLFCDKSWESHLAFATILTVDSGYVMYYRTSNLKTTPRHTYCRAISVDGIHWEKPNIGLFEYNGSKDNNIISNRIEGVSVDYVNGTYWMLSDRTYDKKNKAHREVVAYKSTDGITFERYDKFHLPFYCDSQNEILWDSTSKTFKIYIRSWNKSKSRLRTYHHSHQNYRTVSLLEISTLDYKLPVGENASFKMGKTKPPTISQELPIVIKNNSTTEDFDIYCAYVNKYRENLYIAYPINYYHTDNIKRGGKIDNDGYGTIGFWTSNDGRQFEELKRDYITNGSNWIETCIGHIETEDKFIHYYIPFNNTHAEKHKKNTIRARIHYKKKHH